MKPCFWMNIWGLVFAVCVSGVLCVVLQIALSECAGVMLFTDAGAQAIARVTIAACVLQIPAWVMAEIEHRKTN